MEKEKKEKRNKRGAEKCHYNIRDDTFLINVLYIYIYILANEGNRTSLVNMQKGAMGEIDKMGRPVFG